MYSHLQKLAHNFYLKAKIGDLMARLNDDLDNVQSALAQVTNKALYQAFTVIGSLTALLMLTRKSPQLAIPIIWHPAALCHQLRQSPSYTQQRRPAA